MLSRRLAGVESRKSPRSRARVALRVSVMSIMPCRSVSSAAISATPLQNTPHSLRPLSCVPCPAGGFHGQHRRRRCHCCRRRRQQQLRGGERAELRRRRDGPGRAADDGPPDRQAASLQLPGPEHGAREARRRRRVLEGSRVGVVCGGEPAAGGFVDEAGVTVPAANGTGVEKGGRAEPRKGMLSFTLSRGSCRCKNRSVQVAIPRTRVFPSTFAEG